MLKAESFGRRILKAWHDEWNSPVEDKITVLDEHFPNILRLRKGKKPISESESIVRPNPGQIDVIDGRLRESSQNYQDRCFSWM